MRESRRLLFRFAALLFMLFFFFLPASGV